MEATLKHKVVPSCTAQATALGPAGLFSPLNAACKYLKQEDILQQLAREGHIFILTRLAALLETTSSSAIHRPSLAR